jgi:hypothetical protein
MAEKAQISVKKPEAKRENKVSPTQKTGPSQSISSLAEQILFLQRTIGNQAVGRLIRSRVLRAKLKIGKPGDIYEQEADRVAEHVMRMPDVSEAKDTRVQRRVEGDIKQMSITRDWAVKLNDDELEQQVNIVRTQLKILDPKTPEYDVARQNLRILEAEAEQRLKARQRIVDLSRVLYAEARSQVGMGAVAHVINNRLASGSPAGQVDTHNPWPHNFINTGFLLNPCRPPDKWPHVTSVASRNLARQIIQQYGPLGADPTGGALFYRDAGREDLEQSRPTFIDLRRQVEQGRKRRVTIGGNVFYMPVTRRRRGL